MPDSHRVLEVREPVRIVRAEVGPPILYVVVDDIAETVQIGRHYRDGRTMPCDCVEPCESYRLDYFVRALRLVTIDARRVHQWEPVVLHLTDQAIRTIETQSQLAGLIGGLAGTRCRLSRIGTASNGRIVVREVDRAIIRTDLRFTVAAVLMLRRVPGFAPLYVQQNTDQVETPARTRNDKPREPKGTRG